MYAILATAEFYGNETREDPITDFRNRLIIFKKRKDAQEAADKMYEASIERYGCPYLIHNQASGWQFVVRRINPMNRTWRGVYINTEYMNTTDGLIKYFR